MSIKIRKDTEKIEECNDYPGDGSTTGDEFPSEAQGQNMILKI